MKTVNLIRRIKEAWRVILGSNGVEKFVAEEYLKNMINVLNNNNSEFIDTFKERLYSIIEMGIPNDKVEIMRRGCDELIVKMTRDLMLYYISELQKIKDITDGLSKALHTNTNTTETK
jgi:hypothetical protein